MSTRGPRYPMEEFARRGESIYDHDLRSLLEPDHIGEFVAIDIETGAHEVDSNSMAATDCLYARVPDAQPWMRRVGTPSHVCRFRSPGRPIGSAGLGVDQRL